MKSLRIAIKNVKPALLLLLQETALFLILFLMLVNWFAKLRGSGYIAYRFNFLHFAAMLAESPAGPVFTQFVFILFLLFFLVRLFSLGGVFAALDGGYKGFGGFLADSARHFWRFLVSLPVFLIPAMILSFFLGHGQDRVLENVDHTQWIVYLTLAGQYILFLFFSCIGYFLTLSRWKMVRSGKFGLDLRASGKRLLAYLAYNTLALLAMLLASFLVCLLIFQRSGMLFFAAFLVFQLGMLLKILFQLAAYHSAKR